MYNAQSGKVNALVDMAHKMLRPETYSCALCSLTHGVFREKKAWAEFRKECGVEFEFLHLDEFSCEGAEDFDYPVILQQSEPLLLVADKEKLASLEDVQQLIEFLKDWIQQA